MLGKDNYQNWWKWKRKWKKIINLSEWEMSAKVSEEVGYTESEF